MTPWYFFSLDRAVALRVRFGAVSSAGPVAFVTATSPCGWFRCAGWSFSPLVGGLSCRGLPWWVVGIWEN